jgi:hypothetical protein
MSKPAAIPLYAARQVGAGAAGVLFGVVVGIALLLTTTLLLVQSAPPEAIDGLTSPAALAGRTT